MRIETLANAIMNAHLEKNIEMDRLSSMEIAEKVLAHFGYGNFCLGNSLMPDERELFYQLEDLGITKSSSRVEALALAKSNRYHAAEWRVFQWELNEKRIMELQHVVFLKEANELGALYSGIPEAAFIPGLELKEKDLQEAIRPRIEKKYVAVREGPAVEAAAPIQGGSRGETAGKVKALLSQGKSNKEIAKELGLTAASVSYHVQKIDPSKIKGKRGKREPRKEEAEGEKVRREELEEQNRKIFSELKAAREEVTTMRKKNDALADENIRLKKAGTKENGSGIKLNIEVPEGFLKNLLRKLEVD